MIADLFSSGLVIKSRVRRFISEFTKGDNWHEIEIKKANLGYAWLHYSLIRILKPKFVLCVGSKYGYIPAICALACKDNGYGMVDFVDAGYDQQDPKDKNHWGGVGYWKTDLGRNQFKKFQLHNFITLYVMNSKEFKKEHPNKIWDYIYIDADHSYKGVMNDFKLFFNSLPNSGIMAFHDINTQEIGGLNYGVNRFWNKLKKSKKYNLFELPGRIGLGLIQKPK